MEQEEIKWLHSQLDERTISLMERESDLADRMEEIEAQKEELTAAIEELEGKNKTLETTLQELKERNHELDQILYRASHDLRSPITSIVGILNLLEHEPQSKVQQECYDHIRDKSSQMDELLKSLSTLAKAITNDVHFTKMNVDQLVRSCIGDLKYMPNFSTVIIRTEFFGNAEICSDRLLVGIVIKNLLANSLTFRDPSETGTITIHTTTTDSYLEVEVSDDGEGVADSIQDYIFNIFYRGSERSTGSGLGLYIVRKIVDHLHGHIQHTTNGVTRFKIVIPNTSCSSPDQQKLV